MINPEDLIGDVLVGRYRIESLLSDSAAATKVYDAQDMRFAKKVSVRITPTSSLIDLDSGLIDERSATDAFKTLMQ